MDGGIKKWFMLQVWRMQQVAQIITLLLLAMNLALQLYGFMTWREGLFESPYTAIPLIVLVLVALIWGFAIVWDLRMKMWREQVTVTMEKNPYAKEKMTSKEVAYHWLVNIPLVEKLGQTDPKMKAQAQALRAWIRAAIEKDPAMARDLDEIMKDIGLDKADFLKP
jgi:hypothetical protein